MNKLLPCKCGTVPVISPFEAPPDRKPMKYIGCKKCGDFSYFAETEEEAITAWNKWVTDPKQWRRKP
jgi:hypothetical protein